MDKPKFHPLPTKTMPDYGMVASHVKKHGHMLLDLNLPYNAAHASLHRYGCGLRKVFDVEGKHVGWRVEPVKRHKK